MDGEEGALFGPQSNVPEILLLYSLEAGTHNITLTAFPKEGEQFAFNSADISIPYDIGSVVHSGS